MSTAIIHSPKTQLYRKLSQLIRAEEYARSANLTLAQYSLVLICAKNGGAFPVKELPNALEKTPVHCTRIVNALENWGILTRAVDRDDHRFVEIELTAKGWDFAEAWLQKQPQATLELMTESLKTESALRRESRIFGISPSQYRCILALALADRPLSAAEIGRQAGLKRTTAIEALNQIVAKGLVAASDSMPKRYEAVLDICQK